MDLLYQLEKKIGYKFKNIELAREALSHPSLKQIDPDIRDYEKLEILGDALIGFVITEMLYFRDQRFNEGQIAKLKSYIVSKETISRVAKKLELSNHMIMAKGEEKTGGRNSDNNLENTTEALMAAIYLDSNIETVKKIILSLWQEYIDIIDITSLDTKSYLQELVYKNNIILLSIPDSIILAAIGAETN
ncbi:MAG: ribonuclease III [Rickettsiaceae bacterium]|nr:ribonuclease III [Rickettsiaceae bacterium]